MVIAFLLVLGPLIFLHELGHFLAAKRSGIRALEFGMGYPPRVRRLWRGKGFVIVDGARFETPRNFEMPWDWLVYPNKRVIITYDEINGRAILRSIELHPEEEELLLKASEEQPQPIQANLAGQTVSAMSIPAKKRNVKLQRGAHEISGVVDELDAGTEYTLNWLPIGGFVRMYGEEGAIGQGSFNNAPKRWRSATLLAGPGMNLLVALVVFTVTYMAGYPSIPAVVKQVPAGSLAASAGLQPGDAILSVDRKPLRSSDDVKTYLGNHAGQSVPLQVLRNGQPVQIELPASLDSTDPLRGVQLEEEIRVSISAVAAGSPAEAAQMQPGDVILTVDGQPLTKPNQLPDYVKEHAGQPVKLLLQRGTTQLEVSLIPRTPEQTPDKQGAMGILLQNMNNYKLVKYTFPQAFANAIDEMSYTVQQIVTLPTRLLARQIAPSEAQVVGPVGISEVAATAMGESTRTGEPFWFLNLFAAISLALAITNLLPLPALDGGRLIFILLEAVRGKRISPEREAIVHFVGMMLLLALMVLITIQDVSRLTN